jgi:hypothetical protein
MYGDEPTQKNIDAIVGLGIGGRNFIEQAVPAVLPEGW